MAKVFLFNPPDPKGRGFTREGRCTQESGVWATQWPPVSLATAAALLEKDEHRIKVVDFPAVALNMAALEAILKREKPHFAIWNSGTPTLDSDLEIAALVKDVTPKTITAVMGTHVSVDPDTVLALSAVDVVIRREPERPVRDLCRSEEGKWGLVQGISYRDRRSGKIRHNPDAEFLSPGAIPFPAWHYLDIRPYRLPLKGATFLIVAPLRGCPYPCSFCTAPIYYGKRLRKRPVGQVVDEMEADLRRFKVKDFFVWADTFTADRDYVLAFCREIASRKLHISWACNSRVDTVDRDMLYRMKKAGLWMISFGLESGNREILERVGKRITLEQSIGAVTMARKAGIKTSGHFIFGLPGETEKTMEETLRFALELPLDVAQFYSAAPFPGTRLYEEALERGWVKNAGTAFSQSQAVLDLPDLPPDRVDAFRRYAYKRFYMRPGVMGRLFSMVEPGLIRNIAVNVKRFFRWAA